MTVDGWIMMIVSVGSTTGLFIWCVMKVLATPDASRHVAAPIETDPGDRES